MSNSSTLELARRFVRALNEKDEATIRQIYAPDARIWHNFDDRYQTLDENMRGMYWIHKRMSSIDYDVVSLVELPDGYIQEHVLRGKLPSGADFAMPACVICKVKDGRVTSLREYLDLTPTKALTEQRATAS
jgi:ketosteroid isomerase-like protein